MNKLRFLLLFVSACLGTQAWANPCATGGRPFPLAEGSGIGGTGVTADGGDGSGLGGTGHGDGSGIGGTGRQARDDGSGMGGTGVVGEITGFGSVCVNGLEIHYDPRTPVTVDGAASSPERLAVGQIVAIRAQGHGDQLRASGIDVRHALVGRVDAVRADGSLQVWGQWVRAPLMSRVPAGTRIKVSGYRVDPLHVVASRVEPAAPAEPDVVSGAVEWAQGNTAQVNGVRVRLPQGAAPLRAGDEVRVTGKAEAGGLRGERVEPDGVRGLIDKVERLSIKDRVRAGPPGRVRIGGAEFAVDNATRIQGGNAGALRPGQLVHIDALKKDGRLVIERIEIRDERSPQSGGPAAKAGAGSNRAAGGADEKTARASGEDEPERGDAGIGEIAGRRQDEPQGREDHRAERGEFAQKTERAEKPELPEKAEKIEKPEKAEKVERPEKVEKPEKIEKPETLEKPERHERPERTERRELRERIERPELPEVHD